MKSPCPVGTLPHAEVSRHSCCSLDVHPHFSHRLSPVLHFPVPFWSRVPVQFCSFVFITLSGLLFWGGLFWLEASKVWGQFSLTSAGCMSHRQVRAEQGGLRDGLSRQGPGARLIRLKGHAWSELILGSGTLDSMLLALIFFFFLRTLGDLLESFQIWEIKSRDLKSNVWAIKSASTDRIWPRGQQLVTLDLWSVSWARHWAMCTAEVNEIVFLSRRDFSGARNCKIQLCHKPEQT